MSKWHEEENKRLINSLRANLVINGSYFPTKLDEKITKCEYDLKNLKELQETEKELESTRHCLSAAKITQTNVNERMKALQMEKERVDLEIQSLQNKVQTLTDIIDNHIEPPQEVDAMSCAICFEKYDKNAHQQACITSCFHAFCISCLTSLDPKICPKCRRNFKNNQIKKIF